jgi:hypothetical protein
MTTPRQARPASRRARRESPHPRRASRNVCPGPLPTCRGAGRPCAGSPQAPPGSPPLRPASRRALSECCHARRHSRRALPECRHARRCSRRARPVRLQTRRAPSAHSDCVRTHLSGLSPCCPGVSAHLQILLGYVLRLPARSPRPPARLRRRSCRSPCAPAYSPPPPPFLLRGVARSPRPSRASTRHAASALVARLRQANPPVRQRITLADRGRPEAAGAARVRLRARGAERIRTVRLQRAVSRVEGEAGAARVGTHTRPGRAHPRASPIGVTRWGNAEQSESDRAPGQRHCDPACTCQLTLGKRSPACVGNDGGGVTRDVSAAARPRSAWRSRAAFTKRAKSGCGVPGLLLNSGWN